MFIQAIETLTPIMSSQRVRVVQIVYTFSVSPLAHLGDFPNPIYTFSIYISGTNFPQPAAGRKKIECNTTFSILIELQLHFVRSAAQICIQND